VLQQRVCFSLVRFEMSCLCCIHVDVRMPPENKHARK
jgi:hypothetical protein